ncbi:Tim44 domain-containing protein [Thiomicrospira sp. ALE5]|uniref:Tim44 domain-containing protein n=1 Tax=Thiomicrospira sp. ALE5 TaxID=748650 RepID=UPI0008E68DB4|nr:Tim44-like domain-containing protein [Thiomicrospira sp. ALE5]SFR54849.1 Predicted lipid-binding transport protein, Tim44 family [Thiomicrospira sp. ALE5]
MKNGLLVFASLVLGAILIMPQPADAKRFGGGGSFGKQHSMPAHQRQQQQQQRQQRQEQQQQRQAQRQQAVANSGTSRWLGPLAGLAAGGLLAWMFFGDGFDGLQFMDILLFGALAFGLFMLFRAWRARQSGQYAGAAGAAAPQERAPAPTQYREAPTASPVNQSPQYDPNYSGSMIGSGLGINALHHVDTPTWFNPDAFVEGAKQHFLSVQKAWDQGDASEIESYCTPELFAELKSMMDEIVVGENYTEIDTLNSELVDQSIDGDYFVVSIRFSGYIKESRDDDAHAFNEIWHIRRLQAGEGNWQIAGIQQQA